MTLKGMLTLRVSARMQERFAGRCRREHITPASVLRAFIRCVVDGRLDAGDFTEAVQNLSANVRLGREER